VRPRTDWNDAATTREMRQLGCSVDPHAKATLPPFLSPATRSRFLSAAAVSLSSPLCPSATVPPLDLRTAPPPTPLAPPRFNTGALDPRPPTVIAAPRCGKERAVPLFPPYLPLRVRVPLAAVNPSRPRRGEQLPEP
jgi:hypothetical protein